MSTISASPAGSRRLPPEAARPRRGSPPTSSAAPAETVVVTRDAGELAVAAELGLATAAPDELAGLAAETVVPQ